MGLLAGLPAPTPSGVVNFLIGKVGSYLLELGTLGHAEGGAWRDCLQSARHYRG